MLRRLQLSPLPSADTTAASTDTDTRCGSRYHCQQVLLRLQLTPLPSDETTASSTDTDTDTRGGSHTSVDKVLLRFQLTVHCRRMTLLLPPPTPKRVAAADPLSTLPSVRRAGSRRSADSSSLHCRRLTLPPPPLTPKRVAAAAPLSASAPPTPAVCTTVGCNHYLIDRQR